MMTGFIVIKKLGSVDKKMKIFLRNPKELEPLISKTKFAHVLNNGRECRKQ